jgi:uncharacterized ion transporter superfamily protein YfcC
MKESQPVIQEEVMPKSRLSFLENLHPFVVVFGVILLMMALTFILPGGSFEREKIEVIGMTKEIVKPGTFSFAQSIPQGFLQVWTYFMQGVVEASDVIFSIFLCAGALTAIIGTGAVTAGIHKLISLLRSKAIILIPVLIFAFGLGGAVYGMYEDAIPFILVLAPLTLAMGYDATVALMIINFGTAVGSAACFINPFAVGIGQAMAGLPMTSGIGVRIIMWAFMMSGTSVYVVRYALKVKKDPDISIDLPGNSENFKLSDMTTNSTFTFRHKLVLILVALGFGFMVQGVIRYGWWFGEIGSVFLFMGIIIPLVGGMKINEIIENNMEGMKTVMVAACLLGASRVISMILVNGNIMDTLLFYISNSLSALPKIVTVWIMYLVSSISMTIVQSSSGLAATLMPIMAPLSDLLNIPRQIAVTAYQLGTSTFGFWMPWDGITFALCSMAGVKFFKYLKRCAHFVFVFYIPASLLILAVLTMINFS